MCSWKKLLEPLFTSATTALKQAVFPCHKESWSQGRCPYTPSRGERTPFWICSCPNLPYSELVGVLTEKAAKRKQPLESPCCWAVVKLCCLRLALKKFDRCSVHCWLSIYLRKRTYKFCNTSSHFSLKNALQYHSLKLVRIYNWSRNNPLIAVFSVWNVTILTCKGAIIFSPSLSVVRSWIKLRDRSSAQVYTTKTLIGLWAQMLYKGLPTAIRKGQLAPSVQRYCGEYVLWWVLISLLSTIKALRGILVRVAEEFTV